MACHVGQRRRPVKPAIPDPSGSSVQSCPVICLGGEGPVRGELTWCDRSDRPTAQNWAACLTQSGERPAGGDTQAGAVQLADRRHQTGHQSGASPTDTSGWYRLLPTPEGGTAAASVGTEGNISNWWCRTEQTPVLSPTNGEVFDI